MARLILSSIKLSSIQIRNLDLWKNEQLTPDFLKINPEHILPTIDDNGFILWESNAIAQYLVETYAPDSLLYLKDTKERAVVNQRLQFYVGTLLQIIKSIVVPIFKGEENSISNLKRDQLYQAFGFINGFLSRSEWVAGSHVTLADLAMYAAVSTVVSFGADICEYESLRAWLERCKSLPGIDENSEGVNTFTELFKQLHANKI